MTWHGIFSKIPSYSPKQVDPFMLPCSPAHLLMSLDIDEETMKSL